jgi:hypothetical protein
MKKIPIKKALADKLADLNQPVIAQYDLGVLLYKLYSAGNHGGQALLVRIKYPGKIELRNAINVLLDDGILSPLKTIKSVYKIFGKK